MPFWLILTFILATSTMLILQNQYYTRTYGQRDLKKFEKALHSKEKQLHRILEQVGDTSRTSTSLEYLKAESERFQKTAEGQGIYLFYFENGRMRYWSDHTVKLRSRWNPRYNQPLYFTSNAIYVTGIKETEEGRILGLIKIKTEYPYENEYLKSGFQKDFKLSPEIIISPDSLEGYSDVQNLEGKYLFSMELSNILKKNSLNVTFATFLFMLAILSLFWFLSIRIDSMQTVRRRTNWLIAGVSVIFIVGISTLYFEFPRILFESRFFKPDVFASKWFASLGHLSIYMLLILMVTLLVYWFFFRSGKLSKRQRTVLSVFFFAIAVLWYLFFHLICASMVMDSTISYEAYRLDELSLFTFIGLIILLMGALVLALLIDKAILMLGRPVRRKDYLVLLLAGFGIQVPFLFTVLMQGEYFIPFLFIFIAGAHLYLRATNKPLRYSRFFVLLIFYAVFFTADLQKHNTEKHTSQMEIELAKLSSEHDAVAEMLFPEMSALIKSDSLLSNRLSYPVITSDLLADYIRRNYFNGYWTKYDMIVTPCHSYDSTLIETPDYVWYPCYGFFDQLIENEGIPVEGSDFYFLNNLNGKISYVGVIPFSHGDDEVRLFIELDSKIVSEELGYPSLLLSEKEEDLRISYSYAKYNKGKLVTSDGIYNYRRSIDFYTNRENTFEQVTKEGYNHSVFNVDRDNTVIVSIPAVSFIDVLISFSYLLAFIIAVFSLVYLVISMAHLKANVTWDFKNKIQYSLIGVLFVSFIVICSGTIYFVVKQYRLKNEDSLKHTMRSLYIELVHKVEYEDDLRNWSSEDYFNLDELLQKFANVFYTDINMYDSSGMLLATSRNEIFEQELLSSRMEREAYEKLSEDNYSAFIHNEKIGRMAYQSAYQPLLNNENRFLAYLNLPYFTQPEILTQEVTNVVVAVLNTYVILLLIILFLSVFLADRITQPLRFIQSRIAQLNLSRNNEKITYRGRDEIAGLVREYNHMVDELQRSAELLAQSEREMAWREMAKQIAHEIKNPLTPMKLNVQHMQRLISGDRENIEEQVRKVSQNLIEQIDMLTSIANEFSDFAKTPKAKNTKIDLVARLENVVSLFENSEGVQINLDVGDIKEMHSYGDPEQFQRVIINLVKNGIQSIPEDRDKQITIQLEQAPEKHALITVSDNGKGIPREIQDKLFKPNFTTKSSGMGMGLAISSSIIKSMDGTIWFSTRENEGSKFFIKVPVE